MLAITLHTLQHLSDYILIFSHKIPGWHLAQRPKVNELVESQSISKHLLSIFCNQSIVLGIAAGVEWRNSN